MVKIMLEVFHSNLDDGNNFAFFEICDSPNQCVQKLIFGGKWLLIFESNTVSVDFGIKIKLLEINPWLIREKIKKNSLSGEA